MQLGWSTKEQAVDVVPPMVYFGCTLFYKLHILCLQINCCPHLKNMCKFHADPYCILQSILAILTLLQAYDCWQETATVLFINGTIITPALVHWGEFFQQCTPSANSLFTFKEIDFLWSASEMLYFMNEIKISNLIDLILQIPLPDEDLFIELLHDFHLDDPNSLAGHCTTKLQSLYYDTCHLHAKQEDYYWQHGTLKIIDCFISFLYAYHS